MPREWKRSQAPVVTPKHPTSHFDLERFKKWDEGMRRKQSKAPQIDADRQEEEWPAEYIDTGTVD